MKMTNHFIHLPTQHYSVPIKTQTRINHLVADFEGSLKQRQKAKLNKKLSKSQLIGFSCLLRSCHITLVVYFY